MVQLDAGAHVQSLFLIFFPFSQSADFSIDDYPVPITVDSATDVSSSHAWLMPHPTLRSVNIQPVPPAAVASRAANGSPLNVLGFSIIFSLTLSTIKHDVEALVVPSLGPEFDTSR